MNHDHAKLKVERGAKHGALIVYFIAPDLAAANRAIEALERDPLDGYRIHVSKITRRSRYGGRKRKVELVLQPTSEFVPPMEVEDARAELSKEVAVAWADA